MCTGLPDCIWNSFQHHKQHRQNTRQTFSQPFSGSFFYYIFSFPLVLSIISSYSSSKLCTLPKLCIWGKLGTCGVIRSYNLCVQKEFQLIQGGPLQVINEVLQPHLQGLEPQLPICKAIYRGPHFTPFITSRGAPQKKNRRKAKKAKRNWKKRRLGAMEYCKNIPTNPLWKVGPVTIYKWGYNPYRLGLPPTQ